MKRIDTGKRIFLTVCAFMAAVSTGEAFAAQLPTAAEEAARSTASPSRIQEQLEDRTIVPDVSPSVEVKDVILQQAPPGAENITLNLQSIQLDGVTVYNENQLSKVYGSKLGTTVTLADVYAISSALTNKYRNDGYILTQVIVPPQTIEGGNVRLQVVEGYVDNVSVEGQGTEMELGLIRRYASRIATGQAVNTKDLEKYLLLINDLPGVEARSILSPSRTKTGAADLRIIATRDPFDALLAVDNYGSRYLGPVQLSAAGSLNSFFGMNERLTLQTVVAPDYHQWNELAYIAATYEQPIWSYGTVLSLTASHTDTEPGYTLDQFDVRGQSQYYNVKVDHPIIRTRAQNWSVYGLFDWRDVKSRNNLELSRRDHIRAVRVGTDYELLDTFLGVGINSINLEVAKGLNVFGASDEGDVRMTRAMGDPSFFKVNLEAQRLQRVISNVNLLVAAKGQWSSDALLSSEEFGVGGINYGRGFDPSEIIGDDGVAGKVEIQWNEPHKLDFLYDYQLFGFYDAGRIWNEDPTTPSQKTDTVTSAGFGIRADLFDDVKTGLAIAFPLNRDVETQGDDDPKLYFNLNKTF